MKKRLQGLIAGVLIGAVLASGMVFAKQASETINVIYDNIKILIDGKEYQPKDANGNYVEPFIYNGTTYLPVRGIANAFDVGVDWDEEQQTVELGCNNFELLSNVGLYNYESNYPECTYTVGDGPDSSSVQFNFDLYNFNAMEKELPYQTVTYKLSKKYKTFFATLQCNNYYGVGMNIIIYGDNHKVLYQSYFLDDSTSSIDLEVDVSGNEYLYIEANAAFKNYCTGYIQLNNAKFGLN